MYLLLFSRVKQFKNVTHLIRIVSLYFSFLTHTYEMKFMQVCPLLTGTL